MTRAVACCAPDDITDLLAISGGGMTIALFASMPGDAEVTRMAAALSMLWLDRLS